VAALAGTARADDAPGTLHVFKTPWCGCCAALADRMRQAGFSVAVTELEELDPVRRQAGVPDAMQGCHTAAIDGYVVEGHVPAPAIRRLLAERPSVRGIAVPGMPAGSPGMGDDPNARYDVLTFGEGASTVFYRAGR
jgi:hypothetical protein